MVFVCVVWCRGFCGFGVAVSLLFVFVCCVLFSFVGAWMFSLVFASLFTVWFFVGGFWANFFGWVGLCFGLFWVGLGWFRCFVGVLLVLPSDCCFICCFVDGYLFAGFIFSYLVFGVLFVWFFAFAWGFNFCGVLFSLFGLVWVLFVWGLGFYFVGGLGFLLCLWWLVWSGWFGCFAFLGVLGVLGFSFWLVW